VVILKLREIVDVAVNDNPQGVGLVFRRDVGLGECLGHDG
jgi:hypothetical protein